MFDFTPLPRYAENVRKETAVDQTITSTASARPREDSLTRRQRLVLDAIRTHVAEYGFAPSFREIGEAAGLKSPSSAGIIIDPDFSLCSGPAQASKEPFQALEG